MLCRLNEVADIFDRAKMEVGLETGQETAPALCALLQKLNRRNVVVNFDPANMILYGKGNPVKALEVLGSWIRQVHIKDGIATKTPGTGVRKCRRAPDRWIGRVFLPGSATWSSAVRL